MRHFDLIPLDDNVFTSGHGACPGCGEAQGIKFIMSALGRDTILVALPSCMAGMFGTAPFSSLQIPVFNTAFAAGAATAGGISRGLRCRGNDHTTVVVLAGDGGTYDIGIQSISGAAERGEDILFICINNEGYMNTGTQKSSATPRLAVTASTPAGKPTAKKNMLEIVAAHRIPYAATATVAFPDDLVRKVQRARAIRGFKYIEVLTPCLPGWGMADDLSVHAARLAVETGYFPLVEVMNGDHYTINRTPRWLPLQEFLQVQDRFRHLSAADIAALQADVDDQWARLNARAQGAIPSGRAASPS